MNGIMCTSQYAAQASNIQRALLGKNPLFATIRVGTIDSFFGEEADIVLVSLCRTSGKIGFMEDPGRFNVLATRARYMRYIFGKLRYWIHREHRSDHLINRFANFMQAAGQYTEVEVVGFPYPLEDVIE